MLDWKHKRRRRKKKHKLKRSVSLYHSRISAPRAHSCSSIRAILLFTHDPCFILLFLHLFYYFAAELFSRCPSTLPHSLPPFPSPSLRYLSPHSKNLFPIRTRYGIGRTRFGKPLQSTRLRNSNVYAKNLGSRQM